MRLSCLMLSAALGVRAQTRAQQPDCLHAQGLKRQPRFFQSGILALPFIPIAYLRGVCK